MDRTVLAGLVIAFLVVLLGLMVLGWHLRKRRQLDIAAPLAPPESRGDIFGEFSGKYVATTRAGDPLDRVNVQGLGFRGAVTVTASAEGLELARTGSRDLWIPRTGLREIRRATWTIDRVVEPDGMHLLQWQLGQTIVDTYLRMDNPVAFDAALSNLTERKPS